MRENGRRKNFVLTGLEVQKDYSCALNGLLAAHHERNISRRTRLGDCQKAFAVFLIDVLCDDLKFRPADPAQSHLIDA